MEQSPRILEWCKNCTANETNLTAVVPGGNNGVNFPWLPVVYVVPVVTIIAFLYLLLRRYYTKLRRAVQQPLSLTVQPRYQSNAEKAGLEAPTTLQKVQEQGVKVILSEILETRNTLKPVSTTTGNSEILSITLGPEGKTVRKGCYTLIFQPGALDKNTDVDISVLENEDSTIQGHFRIAPVLRCEPSGLSFKKPFQVIVESSFFAWTSDKLVAAKVSVRENASSPWQDESTTLLGHDGKAAFSATHFSGRSIDCSLEDRSDVGRDMCTFGYLSVLDHQATELTWYVLDKQSNEDYERICKRHSKDSDAMSYEGIKVKLDHRLKLELTSNRSVNLDPNEDYIESWDLHSPNTRSKKFLLELVDDYVKRSTVKYNVKHQTLRMEMLGDTGNVIRQGRIFVQWGLARSESQTSLQFVGGTQNLSLGNNGTTSFSSFSESSQNSQSNLSLPLAEQSAQNEDIRGLPAARAQLPSTPSDSRASTLNRPTVQSPMALNQSANDSVFFQTV